MADRPMIVFDVNETLLDLETLRPTFDRIFSDPAAMRLWFANLITYSEALLEAFTVPVGPATIVNPVRRTTPPRDGVGAA